METSHDNEIKDVTTSKKQHKKDRFYFMFIFTIETNSNEPGVVYFSRSYTMNKKTAAKKLEKLISKKQQAFEQIISHSLIGKTTKITKFTPVIAMFGLSKSEVTRIHRTLSKTGSASRARVTKNLYKGTAPKFVYTTSFPGFNNVEFLVNGLKLMTERKSSDTTFALTSFA